MVRKHTDPDWARHIRKIQRKKRMRSLLLTSTTLAIAGLIIVGALIALWPKGATQLTDSVGKLAPDFTLQDYRGQTVQLSALQGKNIVLFFSEGINCQPACTDQMKALMNDPRFNTASISQFSIVVDQKSSWANLLTQQPGLVSSLLFDTAKTVSTAYNVLNLPSAMHPGMSPGHTYFIVDKQGIIRYAFDDPNMGVNNDELATDLASLS